MNNIKYIPDKCHECQQTTTYILSIDKGTATIVIAMAAAIRKKGINVIHPRKEMEVSSRSHDSMIELAKQGVLKSNSINNLTRARVHGLICKVKGEPGNYHLTRKGLLFLQGFPVEKFVVRSKSTGMNDRYLQPYEGGGMITIYEVLKGETREGVTFDIQEGRVITKL